VELHHNDRLIFGTPQELNWDFAQKELMNKLEKNKKLEFAEYEKAKSQEGFSKEKS